MQRSQLTDQTWCCPSAQCIFNKSFSINHRAQRQPRWTSGTPFIYHGGKRHKKSGRRVRHTQQISALMKLPASSAQSPRERERASEKKQLCYLSCANTGATPGQLYLLLIISKLLHNAVVRRDNGTECEYAWEKQAGGKSSRRCWEFTALGASIKSI
jgi:hypothetical protein